MADSSPCHIHLLTEWPLYRQARPFGRTFRRWDLPVATVPHTHLNTLLISHNKKNKMPSKSKAKAPARITIACNACRSRKQKCSGRKPICEQCLENNRPCNWPEQLRRGPEKGYAEALENRLQLTESILLNLLPHVSDEQLSAAIPRRESSGSYVPFPRLEKRGMESWSQFPLDTSHGIRRWQQACTESERVGSEVQQEGSKRRRLQNKGSDCSVQMSTTTRDGNESINETPNRTVLESSGHAHEGTTPVERMSSWQGAPSFEFQRQFLW